MHPALPHTSSHSFPFVSTSNSGSCKRGKSILLLSGVEALPCALCCPSRGTPTCRVAPVGAPPWGKGVPGMDGARQGAAPWGGEEEGTLSQCNPRHRRNSPGLGEKGKPCLKQ